jgi:hypothetical protein
MHRHDSQAARSHRQATAGKELTLRRRQHGFWMEGGLAAYRTSEPYAVQRCPRHCPGIDEWMLQLTLRRRQHGFWDMEGGLAAYRTSEPYAVQRCPRHCAGIDKWMLQLTLRRRLHGCWEGQGRLECIQGIWAISNPCEGAHPLQSQQRHMQRTIIHFCACMHQCHHRSVFTTPIWVVKSNKPAAQ